MYLKKSQIKHNSQLVVSLLIKSDELESIAERSSFLGQCIYTVQQTVSFLLAFSVFCCFEAMCRAKLYRCCHLCGRSVLKTPVQITEE